MRVSKFVKSEGRKVALVDTETDEEYSIPSDRLADKIAWLNSTGTLKSFILIFANHYMCPSEGSRVVVKLNEDTVLSVSYPRKNHLPCFSISIFIISVAAKVKHVVESTDSVNTAASVKMKY